MDSSPRVLCLHGGGASAQVLRFQARALAARLAPRLRLVFADAPFPSPPDPPVGLVYADCGPFRRWLRVAPSGAAPEPPGTAPSESPSDPPSEAHGDPPDDPDAAARIVAACRAAMDADDGAGEWVAVLGFSQGAKVAASLLWAQQCRPPALAPLLPAAPAFRFGVLMAGSPPTLRLDPRLPAAPLVADPALPVAYPAPPAADPAPPGADPRHAPPDDPAQGPHALSVPTLHVHGLRDPGLPRHRRLLAVYCRPGSARLVEWDGEHRLPFMPRHVDAVAAAILALARETGVHVD